MPNPAPPRPHFFRTAAELRSWLKKNHAKQPELWAGFHKAGFRDDALAYRDAFDEMLCFGWVNIIVRSIDPFTYQVKFMRRKLGGTWSLPTIKRFEALRRQKRTQPAGERAFAARDRASSEETPPQFTPAQRREFRSHPKAWRFFSEQTSSYQRYMTRWVNQAKRVETRKQRLSMLIEDSAAGTKLRRIVEATEKWKKRYPPGQTPIETARNLGPMSGVDLRGIGIDTIEKLRSAGWEDAFQRVVENAPKRLNLNFALALIGAVEDLDWRKVSGGMKLEAKTLIRELKRSWS
ncbi:MAG: YdeI/OmpD-associated family protein [Bacteriovoracia bacterium]